ncbi:hypothetical protein ES703_104509 [subsurface metagenome]
MKESVVGASQYSVPTEYKDRSVDIYATDTKLFVFDSYTGVQIAEHDISLSFCKKLSSLDHEPESGIFKCLDYEYQSFSPTTDSFKSGLFQ